MPFKARHKLAAAEMQNCVHILEVCRKFTFVAFIAATFTFKKCSVHMHASLLSHSGMCLLCFDRWCRHYPLQVGARAKDINIRHFLSGKHKTVTVIDPALQSNCSITKIGQTDAIYRQLAAPLENLQESGFDCLLSLGLDCWLVPMLSCPYFQS